LVCCTATGVDPGYKHGTKLAALSENGAVLELCTLHYTQPLAAATATAAAASSSSTGAAGTERAAKRHKADTSAGAKSSSSSGDCLSEQQRAAVATLRRLLLKHIIGVVAVGNGTGTREAQALIAHAISGLEGAEPGECVQ
jgi:transcriptional accessory protein Tex/SPT6